MIHSVESVKDNRLEKTQAVTTDYFTSNVALAELKVLLQKVQRRIQFDALMVQT